jgi:hypothetical protein
MRKLDLIIGFIIAAMVAAVASLVGVGQSTVGQTATPDHLRATYDPLHFKPAALTATDDQCLACHKEVLEDRVQAISPAGVKAAESLAWYQRLSTYAGDQETFHRRHLVTPLAKALMKLQCNTCHEGLEPREEAQGAAADAPAQDDTGFTLRKQVNPETSCLKCHGQMNFPVMGLKGPWPDVAHENPQGCLTCHANIRTNRHNVNYLDAAAIERAGRENADVCFGCHGGRVWYRIAYPYPRHGWPGMPAETPKWAQDRPYQSEPRFQKSGLNRFLQPVP